MPTKYVIVGAGPAAQAAAKAIRDIDREGDLILISREKEPPYSPVALPYLLNGELTNEALFQKGQNLLTELKAEFMGGREVIAVDAPAKQVAFTDGTRESYDRLLIATGATPAKSASLDPASESGKGFRTFADYGRIAGRVKTGAGFLINGGGLVATELAEKLSAAGCRVTLAVRSRLLRRYFSETIGNLLTDAFSGHGVTIESGVGLAGAEKKGNYYDAILTDGRTVKADALIVATGVEPSPLGDFPKVDGALLVDSHLKVTDDVYAAGDVAAAPDYTGQRRGTCPISPEAASQGRIAGRNMAGEAETYGGWIPGNYLRLFNLDLFSLGQTDESQVPDSLALSDEGPGYAIKIVLRGDTLAGLEAVGLKSIHPGVFRYLIARMVPLYAQRELLLTKPKETAIWLMSRHRASRR
ncbi:MAG: FAD-dependent oxidoreductase [Deltaproteobacteria bacterium]|jgi:NADPH-dependent 2,4-dienoyl-CoA reductase/sulfur reductase-like enzyme|nr:FAD-dependent oxidoreductase [Deltaproteobacteria bacterium]